MLSKNSIARSMCGETHLLSLDIKQHFNILTPNNLFIWGIAHPM